MKAAVSQADKSEAGARAVPNGSEQAWTADTAPSFNPRAPRGTYFNAVI